MDGEGRRSRRRPVSIATLSDRNVQSGLTQSDHVDTLVGRVRRWCARTVSESGSSYVAASAELPPIAAVPTTAIGFARLWRRAGETALQGDCSPPALPRQCLLSSPLRVGQASHDARHRCRLSDRSRRSRRLAARKRSSWLRFRMLSPALRDVPVERPLAGAPHVAERPVAALRPRELDAVKRTLTPTEPRFG